MNGVIILIDSDPANVKENAKSLSIKIVSFEPLSRTQILLEWTKKLWRESLKMSVLNIEF